MVSLKHRDYLSRPELRADKPQPPGISFLSNLSPDMLNYILLMTRKHLICRFVLCSTNDLTICF